METATVRKVEDDILGGLVPIGEAVRVLDLRTPARQKQVFVSSNTLTLLRMAGMYLDSRELTPEVGEALRLGFTVPIEDIDVEMKLLTSSRDLPDMRRLRVVFNAQEVYRVLNDGSIS